MMENPFRYGSEVRGEQFFNREKELALLATAFASSQNVVVVSPRRLGKTSLVKIALERARSDGILTAYVDLMKAPTKDLLVKNLANAMFKGLLSGPRKTWDAFLDFFRHLSVNPTITMGPDGSPRLELPPAARRQDLDADLDRLLELPEAIAERRKKRVVLALDEFQEILGIDPALPARLRSAFQTQQQVAHIYLGSRFHTMNRVFNARNKPFYRSAIPLHLEPMTPEAFDGFIRRRFAASDLEISTDVASYAVRLADGHPNDVQELCFFIWMLASPRRERPTREMVDAALDQILASEAPRYATIWDALPGSQRVLLMALAAEPSKALGEDYRQHHVLGPAARVQKARERLKELELIALRNDGTYHVPDGFFRRWLIAQKDD